MFNALLVTPLFNLLLMIYAVIPGHDFGIAVIIFSALVRLALWPVTAKQLHSQRALQALAPEVAKVKQKAGGDRTKESQMLMELYKAKGINPLSSLLPLLIQLPLFLALFIVLRDVVKPEELLKLVYEPLKGFGPVAAVVSGGGLKTTLFGLIDLARPNIALALIAGGAQYYQTKQLTPKSGPQQPGTAMMGKLFPALTAIIALSLPAALALYWATTSGVAIIQQHKLLEMDAKDLEAKA